MEPGLSLVKAETWQPSIIVAVKTCRPLPLMWKKRIERNLRDAYDLRRYNGAITLLLIGNWRGNI